MPKDCDVLDWDRRGEWNVYPADHIGRPVGTARAFPQVANTVPPTGPWSQEISPMGSNDFRSTKRHIHWAAIHYPDGPGVIVQSNGRQHVRATVQSDRTSVHVNDWYGGAGTSYWEWTLNYGEGKPVHRGDVLTFPRETGEFPLDSPRRQTLRRSRAPAEAHFSPLREDRQQRVQWGRHSCLP